MNRCEYLLANLFLRKDFSRSFTAAITKISWTLFFIRRLSSTSENYFPDLGINLSRQGTYRPLVTETLRPPPPLNWKSPAILSDPKYVVMHANKKGRSSYRGTSTGVYFIPFCITCLLHYDFHQNTQPGYCVPAVIMGSRRALREDGWKKRRAGWANGRKLFSSNWHRGLRREGRCIIFSH